MKMMRFRAVSVTMFSTSRLTMIRILTVLHASPVFTEFLTAIPASNRFHGTEQQSLTISLAVLSAEMVTGLMKTDYVCLTHAEL